MPDYGRSPRRLVIRSPGGIDQPRTIAGIDALTRAINADTRFDGAISITSLDPRLDLAQYQALYANHFAGVPAELRPALSRLVNLDRSNDVTVVLASLRDDPGSAAARDAIGGLRGEIIPSVVDLRGDTVLVGGTTAIEMDIVDAL